MELLAFAGSNSTTSINKRLVIYTSSLMSDMDINIVDLNDYEMPIYSIDREKNSGIPEKAKAFKQLIKSADKIMISFAEHNGSYSVALKNIMDWISRIEGDTWESKPFFLMSTSPGGRGGKTVLEGALKTFSHMGAQVISHFSLPHFHKTFNDSDGITDTKLDKEFQEQLKKFKDYNI